MLGKNVAYCLLITQMILTCSTVGLNFKKMNDLFSNTLLLYLSKVKFYPNLLWANPPPENELIKYVWEGYCVSKTLPLVE